MTVCRTSACLSRWRGVDNQAVLGLHHRVNEPAAPDLPPEARRRPIRARDTRWAHAVAAWLTRAGVQPNQVSLAGVASALVGAGAFVGAGASTGAALRVMLLLIAAACVQLRLLCNLLDGMIAVEGGRRTRTGEIYNEFPDRVSDTLFLAAAGYAAGRSHWQHELGWAAATLAVMTAYVRAFGGQMGTAQQFCGPMAKQQRMFMLTLACLVSSLEAIVGWPHRTMAWALGLIVLGTIVTVARRTVRIAREMEHAP